jgi:hypothetical protein
LEYNRLSKQNWKKVEQQKTPLGAKAFFYFSLRIRPLGIPNIGTSPKHFTILFLKESRIYYKEMFGLQSSSPKRRELAQWHFCG